MSLIARLGNGGDYKNPPAASASPKIHPFSIFQQLPAARATSALFLQEIKYFCVARQTKWRCQREGRAGAGVQTQNDSGGKNCAMFTKFCSEKVEK